MVEARWPLFVLLLGCRHFGLEALDGIRAMGTFAHAAASPRSFSPRFCTRRFMPPVIQCLPLVTRKRRGRRCGSSQVILLLCKTLVAPALDCCHFARTTNILPGTIGYDQPLLLDEPCPEHPFPLRTVQCPQFRHPAFLAVQM